MLVGRRVSWVLVAGLSHAGLGSSSKSACSPPQRTASEKGPFGLPGPPRLTASNLLLSLHAVLGGQSESEYLLSPGPLARHLSRDRAQPGLPLRVGQAAGLVSSPGAGGAGRTGFGPGAPGPGPSLDGASAPAGPSEHSPGWCQKPRKCLDQWGLAGLGHWWPALWAGPKGHGMAEVRGHVSPAWFVPCPCGDSE